MNEVKQFTNKTFCIELALLEGYRYAVAPVLDECFLTAPEMYKNSPGVDWHYLEFLPEGKSLYTQSIPHYLRDIAMAWSLPRLVKTDEQKERFQRGWEAQGRDVSTPWAFMESFRPMDAARMICHAVYYALTGDEVKIEYSESF